MRTSTQTTGGLAIFVLMLTGAMANAQSTNKKPANPPRSPAATDSAANQNKTKSKSTASMQNAQSNPMYQDNKMEGTNPLYERDSAAKTKAPSTGATASHEVVEYKDPEDMTTRYRPGNNKTTKVKPTGATAGASAVEYKDGEDGTMHTRPSNPK